MIWNTRSASFLSAFLIGPCLTSAASDHGLFSFVSRPDIHAPKWSIKTYSENALAPGRWFLAPYQLDPLPKGTPTSGWTGPHIYDTDGSLVWSSVPLEEVGGVEGFTLSEVDLGDGNGVQQMMTAMNLRDGHAVFIDRHYRVRKNEPASGPYNGFNAHELNLVEDGTKALIVYSHFDYNAPREDSLLIGYDGKCSVICNGMTEYDVKTWNINYVWSSCRGEEGVDYIGLEESTLKPLNATEACRGNWDYVHANSVDLTPEGDYLFSTRHTNALYKISPSGEIIWRLGGTKSDFELVDGLNFSRQHHVRYRGGNDTHTFISILDNARGQRPGEKESHPFSRGMMIALDEVNMKAKLVAHYDHPDGKGAIAYRRGSLQILPNKNIFMSWSEQGIQSEHAEDGTLLMHSRLLPEWLGTYRAFKFDDFVGIPLDPPDVAALAINSTETGQIEHTWIYVSWNGATEVAYWKLYQTNEHGKNRRLLSTTEKSGFETHINHEGHPQYVVVEAYARNDTKIGTSRVTAATLWVPPEENAFLVVLKNPFFIASFVTTMVSAIVAAFVWVGRRHNLATKVVEMIKRRRYSTTKDNDGKEPLMKSGLDWDDEVDSGTGTESFELEDQHHP